MSISSQSGRCHCFYTCRYTESGASGLYSLKGADRLRAQLLQQASLQTGLGVALVQVKMLEIGDDYEGKIHPGFNTLPYLASYLLPRPS